MLKLVKINFFFKVFLILISLFFIYFLYSFFSFVSSIVIYTILLIVIVLVGGVLPLYERKFLSLTQRRVGPKFIGYKGRLQFLADALKVLLKQIIKPNKLNRFFFFLVPVIYLNISLFFWLNIFFLNNLGVIIIEYNFVFLIILELLTHLLLFITGILANNKYTIISSNRIINIVFVNEIFSLVVFNIFFFFTTCFSFLILKSFNSYMSTVFMFSLIIVYLILFFLILTNKAPVDIVEAETEIIMGYHVEYSGFLFGLYVLIEYFHLIISSYIIIVLL